MKTILIVDDEEHYRNDLALFLSESGYTAHKAATIEEAKNILLNEPIDYAIIDIKLNFTTSTGGIEVLRFAKESNPDIKCYILSGFTIEYLQELLFVKDRKGTISQSLFDEIKCNYIYKGDEKNYIDSVFEKLGIEVHDGSVTGEYHGLLIGIEDYDYFNKLRCPINDCHSMRNTLVDYYGFSKDKIIFLKDPDRKKILNALFQFKDKLSTKDNLLIFYAGHASWDESIGQGYWLTKSATHDDRSEWISCADIRDHIKPLKARHILLLNDACFSGSVFRSNEHVREEKALYNSSRKAITSSDLEPVPDESVFTYCLLECLKNNIKNKIFAHDLYVNICKEIKEIGNTKALYGVINDSGDQGGDFMFNRRQLIDDL